MKNLDIGCGMRCPPSSETEQWIGVDLRPYVGVTHVLDIGKDDLPIENNSIDFIRSIHVLEHVDSDSLIHIMDEAYRVIKPEGKFHIEVPVFGTTAWLIHPDHKMHWTKNMISFFLTPAEGIDHHGYLKGFWNVEFLESDNPENLMFNLYPNKPGSRFGYKEIKRYDGVAV